jgi:lipoprotein-releasing system permease protein
VNVPFYIARRYLVAKKSHNAINIISYISVMGVTLGTTALIVVLSVFNGFDLLVRSLINSFNPDLKVELMEGKTFLPDSEALEQIRKLPGVYDLGLVLEDKVLVRYDKQQTIAVVKGVSGNYANITGIDSMIIDGEYALHRKGEPCALIGRGIGIYLNVMILSPRQISLFVPRRSSEISMDAAHALNRKYLSVSGVFSIEQDYDMRYILVPLEFAQSLFDYQEGQINMIEIKLKGNARSDAVKEAVAGILGKEYSVRDRYQQNEVFYKTMQAEKWAIFLILVFILIIASFNIIGSLTMLMLEKKKDVVTLSNLGADPQLIKRIFVVEGWIISASGAVIGTLLGLLICWIQMRFGIVGLQGSGSFIIDSYPVHIQASDVIAAFVSVLVIGFLAAWYPIHYFTRRYKM